MNFFEVSLIDSDFMIFSDKNTEERESASLHFDVPSLPLPHLQSTAGTALSPASLPNTAVSYVADPASQDIPEKPTTVLANEQSSAVFSPQKVYATPPFALTSQQSIAPYIY